MGLKEFRSDFLVIGSGIAGLSFALKAAAHGTVYVITKKENKDSATNYAQGGIASVFTKEDSIDLHILDTLRAGDGLCHEDVVTMMIKEGPASVKNLQEWGVEFSMKKNSKGEYDLGREGGHTESRVFHSGDITGREIERALIEAISSHKNIEVFEHHLALDLITEHHFKPDFQIHKESLNCYGAYVFDTHNSVVKKFLAKNTLLCTGGAGRVYLHSTNPPIATADGIAMSYRAGAKLANLEFMQFHPTALYNPTGEPFLLSEAIRGFGGLLRTKSGERFMEKYDEREELASRDIVARAIDNEMKTRGDDYVYLDISHLDSDSVKERFPNIYRKCLEYKFDITKEPVPVVPAAHYMCGGVVTDENGATSINHLWAIGEVACTGVHGANRLASNSLLEGVVFSNRAFKSIIDSKDFKSNDIPDVPEWDESGTYNQEEWVLISHDRTEIQELMWDYVGIIRTNLRLERALGRIQYINKEIEKYYKKTKVSEELVELRNLSTVAFLITKCAQKRKESRGLHFNSDYPNKSKSWEQKDTEIIRNF
ncbi:MAG: L-aspartate oxidase [Candidatus Marinimicrobia bacterium]|nr:L-aspartate oxidase [Candidatus Neomarinimicrobiota bacterium]